MLSKLKQLRLEHGYSIQDVSDKLNIRRQYLIDLEEGNFNALPGKIYVEGYVKIYSKFLGIELQNESENNVRIGLENNLKGENDDLSDLKQDIKYQKYFIITSIISLIIIFFSYNIIRSGDHTGMDMFTEIISRKFRSNNLYSSESNNKENYSKGGYSKIEYPKGDYTEDDILAMSGIYIDQTLEEEDDMVMQEIIKDKFD